jgi:hypothetical protein
MLHPLISQALKRPTSWAGAFELGARLLSKLGCFEKLISGGVDGEDHQIWEGGGLVAGLLM